MSFNDQINVLKAGGCPICACCCSECTIVGGACFALSAKMCCFSAGIGFKAAAAAAAGFTAAGSMGGGKASKAAAALAAAGLVDHFDDDELDVNFCDPCWSDDRGCCEVVCKLGVCYSEVQCPPGRDIGIGCCGMRCCDDDDLDDDSSSGSDAPEQQCMS
ncbi:unnamed protein product [Polarella glacialis]|uniref:Uncharacterized protein n=1 Tax=Polarella glacialis TaxID=89957 RepID=A0A813ECZ8_POLGL|nr:unnamed protein product [Polarella glacialis]CAE8612062.1 unnamed protein product [Polarella glacialis]CAE8677694.1 unnamed protein product [Polarella glacialis]CAE8711097.1 unnamed protein product [Polarella glacialis]